MPTLYVIFDPSDMELRGVPDDIAKKRGIRQAKVSIPDGAFDDGEIEECIRAIISLIRLQG